MTDLPLVQRNCLRKCRIEGIEHFSKMKQQDAVELFCYLIDWGSKNNIVLGELFQGSGVSTCSGCRDQSPSWEPWSFLRVAIKKKETVHDLGELLNNNARTQVLKEEPTWRCLKCSSVSRTKQHVISRLQKILEVNIMRFERCKESWKLS